MVGSGREKEIARKIKQQALLILDYAADIEKNPFSNEYVLLLEAAAAELIRLAKLEYAPLAKSK
ncbi:MAG TPA: hypothetical protein VI612_03210 [Candidatus Nanoarchaeia archaeon]|nr:hypothetical protein [Candidatus Nanoarchaeia archaeon]